MTLEMQVCDRHKNVTGINWLLFLIQDCNKHKIYFTDGLINRNM